MAYLERNQKKRLDPSKVLPKIRSIITLATSYFQSDNKTVSEDNNYRGVIARYARHTDYHDVLAEKLKELTVTVMDAATCEDRSLWYVDTGPILERDLAQRAGLGFIGKHTNLISRKLGNWFFISEILTTLELPPDQPEKNRCGKCTRCITACPTQAITEPFLLDARRCISYLTIELKGSIPVDLRPLIGNRVFGCDDCLEVCPWNRFAHEGKIMKLQVRPEFSDISLEDWARIDANTFKRIFRGSPFYRTKWRGLIRNVCVALGNVGTPKNLPTLHRLADHEDSIVTEHASWAITQINKRESK
ncbi:MAG: Epoxyqueuosine reductase [Verrucomicrobia subdivision 3 bacterium]|nr:Epoxyqueuosine reductase [Limisphaerales bacterium]MCS1414555.1 Epoxyqueuosine reductase [Limisphaerales bacterium]